MPERVVYVLAVTATDCRKCVRRPTAAVRWIGLLLTFAFLLGACATAEAATLSGVIRTDETWDVAHSPYLLTGEVEIAAGAQLTIQPGVQIGLSPSFSASRMFHVFGKLSVPGTAETPVLINGKSTVGLLNFADSTATGVATISHARIRNVGSLFAPTGHAAYGHLDLYDSEVRDVPGYSYVWYPGSDVHIERNVFRNSGGFSVGSYDVKVYILNNTFIGEARSNCEGPAVFICNWAAYGTASLEVHGNDFSNASGVILELPLGYNAASMNATFNYWGTRTAEEVDTVVLDANDTGSRAAVIPLNPLLSSRPFTTPDADVTPPLAPSITSSPTGVTRATNASVSFVGAESGGTFLCSFDGSAFSDCASPFATPELVDGTHGISVKQIDDAGNIGLAQTTSWRVDTVVPQPAVLSMASGHAFSTARPQFTWALPESESDVDHYELLIDGQVVAAAIAQGVTSYTLTSDIADGDHQVRLLSVDTAGNTNGDPALPFQVDTQPPADFTLSEPSALAVNRPSIQDFSWQPATDTVTGIDHYELWIDSVQSAVTSPSSCTVSSCSAVPTSPLGDGSHSWLVKAVDRIGNVRESSTRSVHVDATAPSPFDLAAPTDATTISDATPTLSWASSSDSGSGIDHYNVLIDGQLASPVEASSTSFTVATALADGPHTWRVEAVDANANTRASMSRSFVVDTTAPQTSIATGPSGTTVSTTATITFSSSEGGVAFQCQLDGGTWTTCTSAVILSSLSDGSHAFGVRAVDLVGNADASPAQRSWIIDTTTPPRAALLATPNPALTGAPVTLDASGSSDHADGAITTYAWDFDGDGAVDATGPDSATSHIYADSGTFNATVRVTNSSGKNAVQSVPVEIRPAPPSGPLGVSINDGARYTNKADVIVSATWPTLASLMVISNDGGFKPSVTSAVAPKTQWKLDSSGPERLPKTIYVRFTGGASGRETYQDDIILDQTPPAISSADVSSAGSASAASTARTKTYRIRLAASDKTSGVAFVQTATSKSKPAKLQKYTRSFTVRGSAPKYVRVRDRAGNDSKWRPLRKRK